MSLSGQMLPRSERVIDLERAHSSIEEEVFLWTDEAKKVKGRTTNGNQKEAI